MLLIFYFSFVFVNVQRDLEHSGIPNACESWRIDDVGKFVEIWQRIHVDIIVAMVDDEDFRPGEDKETQNDKISASSRF